jgi:hypothetical protein
VAFSPCALIAAGSRSHQQPVCARGRGVCEARRIRSLYLPSLTKRPLGLCTPSRRRAGTHSLPSLTRSRLGVTPLPTCPPLAGLPASGGLARPGRDSLPAVAHSLAAGRSRRSSPVDSASGLNRKEKPLAVHPPSGSTLPGTADADSLIRRACDTNRDRYRCFLPDLTGFVSVCCAVSNQEQHPARPGEAETLRRGFNPA